MNRIASTVSTSFDVLNRATYWLDILLRNFMAGLMGMVFCLLIGQVVLRYFIRIPLSWVEELATFTLGYLVLIGLAVCFRAGRHVSMNTLYVQFGPRVRSILTVGFCAIAIFFASMMIQSGFALVNLGANELTYSGYFTLSWPRMALIIGGGLLILNAAVMILAQITFWLTGELKTVKCDEPVIEDL